MAAAIGASPGTSTTGTASVGSTDTSGAGCTGGSCVTCGGDNASCARVGMAGGASAEDEIAAGSVNGCAVGGKDVTVGEVPPSIGASLTTTDGVAIGPAIGSVGIGDGCCSWVRGSPPTDESITGVGVETTRTVAVGGTNGVAVSVAGGGIGENVAVGDIPVGAAPCGAGVKVAVGGSDVKVAVAALTPATCAASDVGDVIFTGVGENIGVRLGRGVAVQVAVAVQATVGVGAPGVPISTRQSCIVNGMAMPSLLEKITSAKEKLAKPTAVPTKEIRANSPLPLFA